MSCSWWLKDSTGIPGFFLGTTKQKALNEHSILTQLLVTRARLLPRGNRLKNQKVYSKGKTAKTESG